MKSAPSVGEAFGKDAKEFSSSFWTILKSVLGGRTVSSKSVKKFTTLFNIQVDYTALYKRSLCYNTHIVFYGKFLFKSA